MIIVQSKLGNYQAKNWHKAACQAVKLSQSIGDVTVESAHFKSVFINGKCVSTISKARKEAMKWQSNRSHLLTNKRNP